MEQNFNIENNIATIRINQEIYPKEVIIQTTYVMLEKFYFLIDKNKEYFIVTMKPKQEQTITEKNILEFFDELIESQSYLDQIKRTSKTRQIILERALLGQSIDEETLKSLEEN